MVDINSAVAILRTMNNAMTVEQMETEVDFMQARLARYRGPVARELRYGNYGRYCDWQNAKARCENRIDRLYRAIDARRAEVA